MTTLDSRPATHHPESTREVEFDFYRYLVLDSSDPDQCSWVLTIPVDRESFPALLDQHGNPEPGEIARAANTTSRLLGYTIHLRAVPGTNGLMHRVMVPIIDGTAQRTPTNASATH